MPDDGEVGYATEVLSHCDRIVQIEDDMPPAAGNEYRLAGSLENLQLNIKVKMVKV